MSVTPPADALELVVAERCARPVAQRSERAHDAEVQAELVVEIGELGRDLDAPHVHVSWRVRQSLEVRPYGRDEKGREP